MSMSFCDRKHREERLTSMARWAILIGAVEGFACPHTCSAANLGFTRSCFGLIERPTRTRFLPPKYACASNEIDMNLLKTVIALSVILLSSEIVLAQQRVNKQQRAREVRTEFLHAWNGYKKYAWGHDDLKPLSKTYHDWYAEPLLMTPVDALDTMIIMGLKEEAKTTREYIAGNLSFDKDIEVQNFEITIR